jgi:hypothetical protein
MRFTFSAVNSGQDVESSRLPLKCRLLNGGMNPGIAGLSAAPDCSRAKRSAAPAARARAIPSGLGLGR